jgi:hypothetical protein
MGTTLITRMEKEGSTKVGDTNMRINKIVSGERTNSVYFISNNKKICRINGKVLFSNPIELVESFIENELHLEERLSALSKYINKGDDEFCVTFKDKGELKMELCEHLI